MNLEPIVMVLVLLANSALAQNAQLPDVAHATELRVLAGSAIQPVMNDVIPPFEQASGHRVVFDYGTVGGMAQRVQRGEKADLAVVSGPQLEALQRDGKIVPGTRLDLGKTSVGVFVRKGYPKPDIGSVESFTSAMLAAKSIGYNDPAAGAPVGIYLVGLFERLGIGDAMSRKTVAFKDRAERFGAVARGDVEIGFNQMSEIVAVPEVDLVGPLPDAIQNYTLLSIGVLANSERAEAARALLRYLSAPEVLATFRRRGFSAP